MFASQSAIGVLTLCLLDSALAAPNPYVVPSPNRVPVPQLHYAKAQEFQAGNEKILNVSQNSAQAYSLVSSYDHTNWMSQFSVQSVSQANLSPSLIDSALTPC